MYYVFFEEGGTYNGKSRNNAKLSDSAEDVMHRKITIMRDDIPKKIFACINEDGGKDAFFSCEGEKLSRRKNKNTLCGV
jgi:hypothetical protein